MTIWAAKLSKHVRATSIPLRVEPKVLISIIDPPRFGLSDVKTFVEYRAGHLFCGSAAIQPESVSEGIKSLHEN